MKLWFRVAMFSLALVALLYVLADHATVVFAQDAAAPAAAGTPDKIEVQVDWVEQMIKGGLTVLAQLILSIYGVGIAIERLIYIRQKHFAPPKFLKDVLEKGKNDDWDGVLAAAKKDKSLLSDIVTFIVEHRHNDLAHIQQGAGDIGVREMRHQLNKTYPLAVVGSLEPLLGLLGTMIGMIEAFALVAVYGDEGGASLLADSIAKALITTAVGLIIAIPALGLYYWLKQRIMSYMADLETSVEAVIDEWFLKPEGESRRKAKEEKRKERQALREAMRTRGAAAKAIPAAAGAAATPKH